MVNDNLYTNEHYLAVGTSENQIELLGGDRHSNDAVFDEDRTSKLNSKL